MCGRYTLSKPRAILREVLDNENCPELKARYNVAPTQTVPVVLADQNGARSLAHMRWGLLPRWANSPDIGYRMINARAETVADKEAFRENFRERRCIIPADGFYEWHKLLSGKQPYLLRLVTGAPFGFAGLWDRWQGPTGSVLESFAILTTTANPLVRTIHDRMPVILNRQHREEWLMPEIGVHALNRLCKPYPASAMEAIPVSTYLNNIAHDSLDCMQPVQLQGRRNLF